MLVKIAWRNTWRHRVRSGVLFASVAAGVWAGIFLMAFYFGMSTQKLRTAIEREVSDIQVHHPVFKNDFDVQYTVPGGPEAMQRLAALDGVLAVAGRSVTRAMISSARGSAGVQVNGVMPADEERVTGLRQKLDTGGYFGQGRRNQVIVGRKLAGKLKLRVGSKAVLNLLDTAGHITAAALRVVGIYRTTNTPYEETNLFMDIADLNALLGTGRGVHEIAVRLQDHEDPRGVLQRARAALPGLQVESWRDVAPELSLIYEVTDMSSFIFIAIILLGLSFGIVNTMLMSVLERTRELGMLMALGMNKKKLFGMIFLETLFLVFAGLPFGMLLAWATVRYTGAHGIHFDAFSEAVAGWGYDPVVYPELRAYHYAFIVGMVALTALLSSLFPASKALKLLPAEAIRR
jgi:ABC-type lipoprotein release transport system permease subunit